MITFNDIPFVLENISNQINRMQDMILDIYNKSVMPTAHAEPKAYLNIDEAAIFLKRKKSTLYKDVSSNKIPYLKNGSQIIFSQEDLVLWMNSKRMKTNHEAALDAIMGCAHALDNQIFSDEERRQNLVALQKKGFRKS